jgi:putative hydrolase of the HAD superfamily
MRSGMNMIIDWSQIDTVLLDMDGTLLDLNFDNHFWKAFVPQRYAEKNQLSLAQAKRELEPRFAQMEGKLEWYCLDYWSEQLDLDIIGLKQEIAGLINVLPHVTEFLQATHQSGRSLLLVTNAHRDSLNLKMDKTRLHVFFDRIICSHDYGLAKEQAGFWAALQKDHLFEKDKTLLVDDSLSVLESAKLFGLGHLVAVSKPDTQQDKRTIRRFPSIEDFRQLLPVPPLS